MREPVTVRDSTRARLQRALVTCATAIVVLAFLSVCNASNTVPDASGQVPGEWTQLTPMPEARTEVSVSAHDCLIYVVGGFAAAGQQRASAPRAMWVYDPAADAWSSPGSIPVGVNHSGLVSLAGKLYLVGGFRENTFESVGDVHIYDVASGTWSQGAPMPTPRGAHATVVLKGRIHAIGGQAADATVLAPDQHHPGTDGRTLGTHEVYDPAANRWESRAPMPTARNHLGAAVVAGKIHAVAGRVGGDFTMTEHEVYDAATDSWSAAPPIPTGRSGIAVVELADRGYVFGGEMTGADGKTFDEAERFDPAGHWAPLPRMPTARHGLGAAVVNGAIYVISGGPSPGFAFSGANERLIPKDRSE
jgi:hypothetical protein